VEHRPRLHRARPALGAEQLPCGLPHALAILTTALGALVVREPARRLLGDDRLLAPWARTGLGPGLRREATFSRPIEDTAPMLTFFLDDRHWLRLLEEADIEELFAVVEANRAYLAQWMPWAENQTLDGTLEFIRTSRKQLGDNQGFQAAIIEDDAIVGVLGYHRLDWEHLATSVGYWIAERSQGNGTVTRATAGLVDHAFGVWKLNRVQIQAAVSNERSRAIPERLGFTQEGVLRQAERIGNRFVDHVVYSILAHEWSRDSLAERRTRERSARPRKTPAAREREHDG
jgi:ribosomal-protein-serine acetyltransferase